MEELKKKLNGLQATINSSLIGERNLEDTSSHLGEDV